MPVEFHRRDCCPLCKATGNRILCEIPYHDQRLASFIERYYRGIAPLQSLACEDYRIIACVNCDFVYQDPILNEEGMQALYRDWVDHAQSLHKKQTANSKRYSQYAGQVHTLARLFNKSPDEVRVLDFGMGWGYWSRMAQAHGFNVTGYELSPQRSAHAHALGIKVVNELPVAGPHFDYIYASQVFEHLPDPLQSLQDLSTRLAPGGIVYIRVPDGRGVVEVLARRGWSQDLDAIHPLEHINCFTRKTLLVLTAAAGMHAFDPPLRLNWGSLWGGLQREIADRYFTTHLFLRR